MQTVEIEAAASLCRLLPGCPREEATIFIPSIITAAGDFI
jgi:hypothetical protein